MTRNQIEYWKLKETVRSNKANEAHAKNVLTYNYAVLNETKRSNLAREAETHRANVARETETTRSNKVNESISLLRANRDYTLSLQQLQEQQRANKASEALRKQVNTETERQNRANEAVARINSSINLMNAYTNQANQLESVRSHRQNEAISLGQLNETVRTHKANESLNASSLNEQIRNNNLNYATRQYSNLTNRMNVVESARHNRQSESELQRSNLAKENLEAAKLGVSLFNNSMNAVVGVGKASVKEVKLAN